LIDPPRLEKSCHPSRYILWQPCFRQYFVFILPGYMKWILHWFVREIRNTKEIFFIWWSENLQYHKSCHKCQETVINISGGYLNDFS